jgi:two-component system response regulator MprA
VRAPTPTGSGRAICGSASCSRHGVIVGERFVELTRTEYGLLELLIRNPRRVLPHSVIYDRVWGYDFGPASNALRVYVGYLRRKLEQAGARPLIHTVRGVGYVLREP